MSTRATGESGWLLLGVTSMGAILGVSAFWIVIGMYIAAVLSAVMSTVDSLLVVASSAVTRDFYQQIFHPEAPDSQLTRLS